MSLKRVFKFAKPKNPGYGISKNFYLSVLAGHAQLPSPDEIANPQGARGAVEGFLAPLMSGSCQTASRFTRSGWFPATWCSSQGTWAGMGSRCSRFARESRSRPRS